METDTVSTDNALIPSFAFATPPHIVFGWDAIRTRLGEEAKILGKRPLIVCGNSLRKNGRLDAIVESLRANGLSVALHEGVRPEPDLDAWEACRNAIRAHNADLIIAIGGGSVLDVGKASAATAQTTIRAADYLAGRAALPETGVPIIAVPTTAGTGSEATWVSVLTDKSRSPHRKASIRGNGVMPNIALVDPALTVDCPVNVTAASGMDAFVQAVEAYTANGANPLTDALAFAAVRYTRPEMLARAVIDPLDRIAHESLSMGSLLAGMALNTSRLGLVHGLAHPVGAISGAAHGGICAMLLAPVMRFNRDVCREKYAAIAAEIGFADVETFIEYLDNFVGTTLHLPTRLSQIGITESDLEYIASEAMKSGSTKANPRTVTQDDAYAVALSVL